MTERSEIKTKEVDPLNECKNLIDISKNNRTIAMNIFYCMNEYFKTLKSGVYCKELFTRCLRTSSIIDILALKGSYIEAKTLMSLNQERYIQFVYFLTYPERNEKFYATQSVKNFDKLCKRSHVLNILPSTSESMSKKVDMKPAESISNLIYTDLLYPFTDKVDIALTKDLIIQNNNNMLLIIKKSKCMIPLKNKSILQEIEKYEINTR